MNIIEYIADIRTLGMLDLIGTFVFALSGALAGAQQRFDAFGVLIVAFVTAVGGGTLRDVLIGNTPVSWMEDMRYIALIFAAVLCSYLMRSLIFKLRKTLFLFDTIGIAVFTILGLQKTLDIGLSPVVAVMMGTVSAVFGGVIRDILCNIVPLIFRKEIYAITCIAGGSLYLLLCQFIFPAAATVATVGFIIALRVVAVVRKWHLPKIEQP